MLTNDDVVSLPLARRRRGRCRSAAERSAGRGWAEPAPARVPRLLVGLPLAARSGAARGFTPAAAQDRGEARRRRGFPRDGHRSRASVSGRARRGRRRASAGRSRHGARPLRASAQDEPEPRAQAEALGGLGRLALRQGDPSQAVDSIEEALRLAPSIAATSPGLVRTLGKAYAEKGELESAIGVFERAATAAGEAGDPLEQARCEVWLANAHIDSGNFGRAEELLGGALARTPPSVDPAQRARIYWSQSRLHTLKGNQDAAARYARKTLELPGAGRGRLQHGARAPLLAFIADERGRGEEALHEVQRGLDADRR